MNQDEICAELRRVAELLQTKTLTRKQFSQYGKVSSGTVVNKFGSWTKAILAAGLLVPDH